jgi:hypothetical protein
MARPKLPAPISTGTPGAAAPISAALGSSTLLYPKGYKRSERTDRAAIALPWQREAYRQVNICGEARYAATLFANIAARAEIGVSEPNTLQRRPVWVNSGPEAEVFAELAPSVRERAKLVRDFMAHFVIAGECYLIARPRVATDPDPSSEGPIWEVVAVTELQRIGDEWKVRHDNNNYITLTKDDPVIRIWNPDPENRREAWSPFRSLLPTLREIEWFTKHIFTQVQSRLMSSGVWFIPDDITFPKPPPDMVAGGAEAIAGMNEAEQFMLSLAVSSTRLMEGDEVAFPTVVMADPKALESVDQRKLIQFWSEIDDKAMILRSDAVRRFSLGMDLPPEQILGSSGLAVTGAGGSAGSVNHWGVWANEEQTISAHIEPALDIFVGSLTSAFLRSAVEGTELVLAYDTATLRLRQDRSKEAIELYDRGVLKAEVMVRETGFDPEYDMMDEQEHRTWLLNRIASGSATPEQVQAAFFLLTGHDLPVPQAVDSVVDEGSPKLPDTANPSLEDHPYEGPPREQHDNSPAPFGVTGAAAEGLALRALEKAGNRLLNDGKRGRDRDRITPAHLAHTLSEGLEPPTFDFSLLPTVFSEQSATYQAALQAALTRYCTNLYLTGAPHSREALLKEIDGL